MFRLLKLRYWTVSKQRLLTSSIQSGSSLQTHQTCSFCQTNYQNVFHRGSVRNQSTTPKNSPLPFTKKKKRVRRTKNFIELLQVTSESATETKTPVTNLSAKNLSILTQTKLNNLQKPQNSHLTSNFSSYSKEYQKKEYIAPLNPAELSTELLHEEHDAFHDPKLTNPAELLEDPDIQNEIIEELSQTQSAKKSKKRLQPSENLAQPVELKAREETLSRILLAYCDLCVAHDKTSRGLKALHFYLNRAKRNPTTMPRVLNIKVYNCLIEGFAGKGNYNKIMEILQIMQREHIQPDIQSYVGVFECLGRLSDKESKKLLETHLQEIQKLGFELNDLMDHGIFVSDRRETVLTALKRVDPTYVPKYTKPQIQYDCSLLEALNHPSQLNLFDPPKKIFLNSNINQLDNEFFESLKHKSCQEIKNEQLQSNIVTLLNRTSEHLNVGQNVLSNTNTYHPLSVSIPNFEVVSTGISRIKDYMKFITSPTQIAVKSEPFQTGGMFEVTELKQKARKQMNVESTGFITVASIEKQNEPTEIINHFRQKIKETQKHWENHIKFCIKRDLQTLHAQNQATGGARGSPSLHECLHAVPIDELSQILLQEVRRLAEGSETYSPTLSQLYREVGQIVHSRYQVRLKKQTGVLEKVDRIYEKYCEWYANYYTGEFKEGERRINPRQYWQGLAYNDQTGPSLDIEDRVWPYTLIIAVGKFLYNIIMKDLKVDVNAVKLKSKHSKLLPAFYSLYRSQGHVIKEEVKAHPVVSRLFRGAAMPEITFNASALPMQCPPKPWAHFNTGGYLVVNTDMLRLPPQATQQIQRLIDASLPSLYPSFDSLNQLASVPWTVNEPILDIVLHLFQEGGNGKLGVAPPPDSIQYPSSVPASASKTEKFQAFRQRMIIRRRKAEMYSLWCDALYRLSLANHFRKQTFWLPHNMDFRGRVYPVPPHLTHLGADLARALLIFADKKPLGPDGLRWLKLHLVNLLGTKKRQSIDERLEYVDETLNEILDSADNPMTGRMWWAQSEEPWQTLACCKEIANAIRSPDPCKYETNFPIHQDGSCNGLQHYAALGRDAAGAKSVNLTPSEYPQDVYSAVATLVEEERRKDAAAGVKVAEILDGFVKRKVIKQTVMTTVYGVTRFGARLQIAKQLKDIDDFPKESVWQASSYLTAKTFESLRSMFTSTREIQDWFTECAKYISGNCLQNVEWVTPLGLPIVQPYNRYRKIDTHNSNKNRIAEHFATDMFERPNVMKQKNAFPPNFIHSLDSSHMMLTSVNCERAGITFVSVHDCFWTHPSTVSIMNKLCREQFVALHSEPILESLSEFLCQKYAKDNNRSKDLNDLAVKPAANKILRQLPKTGDFNLQSVLNSIYFFS